MAATAFTPLKALQSHYDDTATFVSVSIHLLDNTVTELLDSYETPDDLPGQVAGDGTYDPSTGIAAGDWPLYYDTTAGAMELSTPDATWASEDTFSLTFRWVVLTLTDGAILSAIDMGQDITLDDDALQLHAEESEVIPNSYPVFRWTKVA